MEHASQPIDDVIAELAGRRGGDVAWSTGRTFSLVYDGGPSVHDVAGRAAAMYLHENALNTAAFPSLASFQSDVVRWTADLLHGPATAAGFLTSALAGKTAAVALVSHGSLRGTELGLADHRVVHWVATEPPI